MFVIAGDAWTSKIQRNLRDLDKLKSWEVKLDANVKSPNVRKITVSVLLLGILALNIVNASTA